MRDQADLHQSRLVQVCENVERISPRSFGTRKNAAKREGPLMKNVPDVAGTAALAICESLLLALNDRNILPEGEILGILRDAAASHENDPGADGAGDLHRAVSALINSILAGGNSVRHKRPPR